MNWCADVNGAPCIIRRQSEVVEIVIGNQGTTHDQCGLYAAAKTEIAPFPLKKYAMCDHL